MENADIKYLKVLATQYPNIAAAATEIVNLKAILSLPKATEHFITDVHGEYEQFRHVMCNGSGAVQRKIEDEFGSSLGIPEKRTLATLIYYPELKIKQIEGKLTQRENLEDWYKVTIFRLIRVCKNASSKYTRSKVRKSLPKDFAYIIEELMTGRPDVADQEAYYNEIINSVIHTGRAAQLIIDFCYLVRRFTVDHLHVVGDIFDRVSIPASDHGRSDDSSFCGHPMGKPRYPVDGSSGRFRTMYVQYAAYFRPLRQPGDSGGCVRDQYDPTDASCH